MNGRISGVHERVNAGLLVIVAGSLPAESWVWCNASAVCFMLFWQLERAAASRTFCTAGSNNPIKIAIIAITTSSSISVNPARLNRFLMTRSNRIDYSIDAVYQIFG